MPMYTFDEEYSRNAIRKSHNENIEELNLPPIGSESCFNLEAIWNENPFSFPKGMKWIDLSQEEKLKNLMRQREERSKPLREKHIYSTRHAVTTLPILRQFVSKVDSEIEAEMKIKDKIFNDHALTSAKKLPFRPMDKETTQELINRKREMFLVNFTLQTKKDEISELKLKEIKEEKSVNNFAERIRKDAFLFDEFLKATDQAAADAMKSAEKETKLKAEKIAELRRTQVKCNSLKGKISKLDEVLAEYLGYKSFLLRFHYNCTKEKGLDLTNEQWMEKSKLKIKKKSSNLFPKIQQGKLMDDKKRRPSIMFYRRNSSMGTAPKKTVRKLSFWDPSLQNRQLHTMTTYPHEWHEDEREAEAQTKNLEPIMKNVKCIITVIHQKEEENLKLIYHFQATKDSLDELKASHDDQMMMMDKEIARLKDQVAIIDSTIYCTEKRFQDMQLMCRILGVESGIPGETDLDDLNKKVEKVYVAIFGKLIINIDSLTMLTCIEKRMDQLIDVLDAIPETVVRNFQKMKDRKRRFEQREEKILLQRKRQTERSRRASERANDKKTKRIGRKLMFRSAPATIKPQIPVKQDEENVSDSEQFLEKH